MKLTHPESGQKITVLDGSEGPYLRNGWLPVEKKTPAPARRSTATTTSPERGSK